MTLLGDGQVTYLPIAGGSFEIDAIFDTSYQSVDPGTNAVVSSHQPTIGIRLSDLPAAPAKGDTVVIDSVTYRVIESQPDGVVGATLFLHKTP